MLLPENDAYQPIEVDLATQNFAIEGLWLALFASTFSPLPGR